MTEDRRVGISNRLAQRSGFGIIIGLLAVSTLMAWGIQESFSEKSFQIHRRFVQEQELLGNLRRVLWRAGLELRDHFLNPVPDRDAVQELLTGLEQQQKEYLSELRGITSHQQRATALADRFEDLWTTTRAAVQTDMESQDRFTFIQREIVPRRNEAGRLLGEIESANRSSLTDSELEMRDTRAGAANRLLLTLGICLICGVAVAWVSIRHAEELEQEAASRFREVLEAKQQLEHLSARLMEVQEEERTRLSRELHDEIVQNLAVLKMEIVQAQQASVSLAPSASGPLARARRLAEDTVRSVRDISVLLRPSLLDDLGLGPALQWQAEEFSHRTGVPCKVEDEELLTDELPESIKTCVYRVTQEALRNCEKHSQATSVIVRVRQSPGELEVRIEDNGKGFSSDARKPSNLGLLGMRERAYALGGQLETRNRQEGGACVRLVLPLTDIPVANRTGVHS